MVLISDTIYQVTRIKEFLLILSVWLTWPRRVTKILVKIFAVREVSHSVDRYL